MTAGQFISLTEVVSNDKGRRKKGSIVRVVGDTDDDSFPGQE
jgi:hypothetical protein